MIYTTMSFTTKVVSVIANGLNSGGVALTVLSFFTEVLCRGRCGFADLVHNIELKFLLVGQIIDPGY